MKMAAGNGSGLTENSSAHGGAVLPSSDGPRDASKGRPFRVPVDDEDDPARNGAAIVSPLGLLLEQLCDTVVQRTPHLRLWEPDYAWWVSAALAAVLQERGGEQAHERILHSHGVLVEDLKHAAAGRPDLLEHFRTHLKPGKDKNGNEKKQNEITSDIQVFSRQVTATPPRLVGAHMCLYPWEHMPAIEALVEIKVPTSAGLRRVKFARDLAKLAVFNAYYAARQAAPVGYLGAWILLVDDDREMKPEEVFFERKLGSVAGAERVRVVLFRHGTKPRVLRPR